MEMRFPWQPRLPGILLVCRANLCRSPMAESLLRYKLRLRGIAARTGSAGTQVSLRGQKPDPRVKQVLEELGIPLVRSGARPVRSRDFADQSVILAMDAEVLAQLQEACPEAFRHKLRLVTEYAQALPAAGIPDPYYGNLEGFRRVHALLDEALDGFLDRFPQVLARGFSSAGCGYS